MSVTNPAPTGTKGIGRPARVSDIPMEVVDFGTGTNTQDNPLRATAPSRYLINVRTTKAGLLTRRKGYKVVGENTWFDWEKLSDPASLPASDANGVAFSHNGQFLAVAHDSSPYITIYSVSGTTLTKLSDPSSLPSGNAYTVTWSQDDTYLVVGHQLSPFITIYKRSGTTFTKLSDPSVLPDDAVLSVAFDRTDAYLAVAQASDGSSTPLHIYDHAGDTFTHSSRVPNTAGASANVCKFTSDGSYLLVGTDGTVSLKCFTVGGASWSQSTPGTSPGGHVNALGITADGSIVVGTDASPYMEHFILDSGTLTKQPAIEETVPTEVFGLDALSGGQEILVAHHTSPYIAKFGAVQSGVVGLLQPADVPTGNANGVAYSDDGSMVAVAHDSSPYITVYKRVMKTGGAVRMLDVLDHFSAVDELYRIVDSGAGVRLQKYIELLGVFEPLESTDMGSTSDQTEWFATSTSIGGVQRLYMTNGVSDVTYTDGNTISTVSGVKGRYIATVENIMMVGHLTATYSRNQAVYTKAGTHQFYSDEDSGYADSSYVISVDGEITQCVAFNGFFYLFTKDAGLWVVDMRTGIPRKVSTEGTNAPRSVSVGFDIMIWLNKDAVWALPAGGTVQRLSDKVEDIITNGTLILK